MSDTAVTAHFPAAALPAPLTAFIGREQDLSAVLALLHDSRLLTLTGAGGSGKTRLAIAAAESWARADHARQVAWVELADLTDPAEVAARAAVAFGVRAEGGGSLEQAIGAVLLERDVLLVLDNCEHLVEACAALVERLLRLAPRLRVLATSREALAVSGERSWLVPTLTLPPEGETRVEAALQSGAVRLFVERARDVRSGFALTEATLPAVIRIVRQLDGLPLAIELAAARVAVLTPAQLAERLDGRLSVLATGSRTAPPRQRTLRGTVDWSYELLTEDERLLLDRLSVFVGGFSLEAAEAVCGFGALTPAQVLELLAALATKSLVAMQEDEGTARYRLLEMIREYASERRRARPEEDAINERHALFFRQFVQRGADDVILGRRPRLRERDVEHGNILAAMAWSARARRGDDIGLPMVWALQWYWYHRQLWHEGFAQNEQALASADAPTPALRAAALHGLAVFGLHRMQPGVEGWLDEAERLWIAAGEERWLAFTLLVRVVSASIRGDVERAGAFAERMLALAERQPDPWDAALAKAHGMTPVLVWRGQWDRAMRLLEEAVTVYRQRGYDTGVSYALDAQAFVALRLGDPARAAALAVQSLRNEWDNENRWLAGRNLRILATVAEQRGDLERAARLFSITDVWYETVGASSLSAERALVNDLPGRLRARMSPAAFEAAWSSSRSLSCREAMALAVEGEDTTAAGVAPVPLETRAAPAAPLEVTALGPLAIRLHGRLLTDEDWPYAKPRELLLYLLAHPEGRTREQIGLVFWPESSAAQVKNSFHVTLHHLRRTLGEGTWVRYAGGRYVVDRDAVSFDVARFLAEAEEGVRRLRADAEDAEALAVLETAIARYRGPFLEEESAGDWHLELRDRAARMHLEALLAVAEALGVEGRYADAAERFRQVLAADPLHEEAARSLMLTLARDEKRSEALRVYDRLSLELQRELRASPSARVRRTADAIRAGDRV